MTPEQERTFDKLMQQVREGKMLPCILGDWAYANGCLEAAMQRYNMTMQNLLGQMGL